MKIALRYLRRSPNRKHTAFEVDEELQFHIEMLEHKYAQQGMSDAQAKAAALKRFGNLERVKKQCVVISRRSSLFRRGLKLFSVLIALTGLSIYILSSDYKVARVGTMLITIAVSARLLVYVRGLIFLSGTKTSLSVVTDTPKDAVRT
jgi:hypothetical protein